MKRIDVKIWLLLLSVVPLCGNTCSFHSVSNNGTLHIAVCVPPTPACQDPHPLPPPEEPETDPDQDTSPVAGQTRIAAEASADFARTVQTAQASVAQAPVRIERITLAVEGQSESPGDLALAKPAPGLGPFSLTVLGALLVGTACRSFARG